MRRGNVNYSDIGDVKGTVTDSEASRVVKMNVSRGLIDSLIDWFICLLIDWLIGLLIDWLIN